MRQHGLAIESPSMSDAGNGNVIAGLIINRPRDQDST